MSVQGTVVSVPTSGTVITIGSGGQGPAVVGNHGVTVKNSGTVSVYLDGGTTNPGTLNYTLAVGEYVSIGGMGVDDVLYGSAASGTGQVSLLAVD